MEEIVCRTCLKPQTRNEFASMFDAGGKIAKEIFKLANITILEFKDLCPAVICERCQLDLDRIVQFRKMIIASDEELKRLWGTKNKKITSQINKEMKRLENPLNMESGSENSTSLFNIFMEQGQVEKIELIHDEEYNEFLDENDQFDDTNLNLNDSSNHCEDDPMDNAHMQMLEPCISIHVLQSPKKKYKSSDSDDSETEMFQCNMCGKKFRSEGYLNQHFKTVHTKSKRFKCPKCGRRYEDEEALDEHVAKHISEKPFKCTTCSSSFNHKHDLKRHMLKHSGIFPHKCSFCGKGFIRRDHMLGHMRKHERDMTVEEEPVIPYTTEKPFACSMCSASFVYKQDLKRHMVKHSGVLPHKCRVCGKGFVRKDYLTNHLKIHERKLKEEYE